jgi:hypothetical protein
MHAVSLDAAKAFDKLWRTGLFFKLIGEIDPFLWRILYEYYKESYILVLIDGTRSEMFRTTEGVKQGGILSPFLFNFFLNELLEQNEALGIGAQLGSYNTSTLAYCDDLLILASNERQMSSLLDSCYQYACKWKLSFNASKSVSYSLWQTNLSCFSIGNVSIPVASNGFIYLGLPIGNSKFVEDFFINKMRKVEKSMYSLRSLGCKSGTLHPRAIAFIYKQYCQSIIKFGLENLHLDTSFLNLLNVRQNILIKNVLGINYNSRSKVLMNELKIENLVQLYEKHKIFGIKQFTKNNMSRDILIYLNDYYLNCEIPNTQ